MPGNKLHFSLRAAAATPLLGDNFTAMLHTLFKIFIKYVCVYLVYLRGETDSRMKEE